MVILTLIKIKMIFAFYTFVVNGIQSIENLIIFDQPEWNVLSSPTLCSVMLSSRAQDCGLAVYC
jgi:hypothetical protein